MNRNTVALSGTVDVRMLLPFINEARNQARRSNVPIGLEFDCTGVDDFTSLALAHLAKSRRGLEHDGSDLALIRCSERVKSRMVHPLFEALCE